MTNLFDYTNYKEFLLNLVQSQEAKEFTRTELAKAMGCQAAYLSQVLGGKAELTEDHGLKLCQYLSLSDNETEYFLVVLRMARAGTKPLMTYLESQRKKLHQLHLETEGRIRSKKADQTNEMEIYYCSSWIPSVVHAATSCKSYQTVEAISQKLGLKKSVVEYHLRRLEKYQLVEFVNGRWIFSGTSIHFQKNSPLDHSFQLNRRLLAMKALASRGANDIHYSVVFAANSEIAQKLRHLFLDAVERLHFEVEPSPSEELYSVNLDFFSL